MTQETHEDEDGYTGSATVVVGEQAFPVEVALRGVFQPIDGYYHWYGRVTPDAELATKLGGKKADAVLRTPEGEAGCKLSDPDPWGRYHVLGTSTPPFRVPTTLDEVEQPRT